MTRGEQVATAAISGLTLGMIALSFAASPDIDAIRAGAITLALMVPGVYILARIWPVFAWMQQAVGPTTKAHPDSGQDALCDADSRSTNGALTSPAEPHEIC